MLTVKSCKRAARREFLPQRRRENQRQTPTAARLKESEPAVTNSDTASNSTAASTTPASKEKAGGRYKFNFNRDEPVRQTSGQAGAQPFAPAQRDLRMNRAAARFTSSAPT